ncbi:MAG: MFS transporter [Actinobacteria bacterium]|nr:MFS transporter [Actinomycetota bacterium]
MEHGAGASTIGGAPLSGDGPGLALADGRSPWALLAVVLFGLFSVNVTVTILAVSIPRIARELHSTQSTLTWVVAGPILAFGIIGPAVGKLGDLWGQRRIYLLGLAGAALMAGASALAWSAPSLITFRVLGAVEGAATGPASFALISLVFPLHQRVKALGFWSMVAAGGPVIGVVIGGPLVSAVGWRVIFAGQVPLCLVALAVAWRLLPETPRQSDRTFDWAGAALLAATATPLLFALNLGPQRGWSSPVVVGGFAVSPLALAAFVAVERRAVRPLVPLHYFSRRNFSFALAAMFLANAAYMGSFVLTPLLLQNVLGYNEAKTGFVSIARPLSFSITGPLAGFLAVKVGERVCGALGGVVLVVAMVWMSTIRSGSTAVHIMIGLALAGVALGISSPSMGSCITGAVERADLGVAGAAQQMMIQVGTSFGIQLMQSVQAARQSAVGAGAAFGEGYLVGGVLAAIATVAALCVRRLPRHPFDRAAVALAEAEVPAREWGATEGAPALLRD